MVMCIEGCGSPEKREVAKLDLLGGDHGYKMAPPGGLIGILGPLGVAMSPDLCSIDGGLAGPGRKLPAGLWPAPEPGAI